MRIEELNAEEIAPAADLLGRAFVNNPSCIAVWRGRGERERLKQASLFRLTKLGHPRSRVLVARDEGKMVGVLNMIKWPHCQPSLIERLRLLPAAVGILRGATFRALEIQSGWARHDPQEPHWHLGPVGVLPEAQGQGVGSLMLGSCCDLVDQSRAAAYLETDKPENVRFYRRFGFSVTGQTSVIGVTTWFMWRPR